jgi:hypothetical protein
MAVCNGISQGSTGSAGLMLLQLGSLRVIRARSQL